jgi:hypothetical protein
MVTFNFGITPNNSQDVHGVTRGVDIIKIIHHECEISYSVFPDKFFQLGPMFVGKSRAHPSGSPHSVPLLT